MISPVFFVQKTEDFMILLPCALSITVASSKAKQKKGRDIKMKQGFAYPLKTTAPMAGDKGYPSSEQ